MTTIPLIDIPEERKQQELRRATNHAGAAPLLGRRARLLALVCCAWLLLGFGLLGLAFHLTDSDQAQAAFLAAILVGNGGPAWTLVLAHWSANQTKTGSHGGWYATRTTLPRDDM